MTADDQGYVRFFKNRQEAFFRRQASEHLRVASRRGMAKQHFAQAADLDAERLGPARQQPLVFRIELPRHPAHVVAKWFRDLARFRASHLCEHHAVAVALDELYWNIEVQKACEGFTWHRARKDIAPDHDPVYLRLAKLFEYSLERGEVAVNIVECSDPHTFMTRQPRTLLKCRHNRHDDKHDTR